MTESHAGSDWTIQGSDGEPIFGNVHRPKSSPIGVVLIVHGFKGYKDYGMFPHLGRSLADAGFVAHRFNFSHSGMTNDTKTFARPDLFEQDTWNKQVFDFAAVMHAVRAGDLEGHDLPIVLLGHSRGGVSAILTAGRHADQPDRAQPAGVVTAAAPATCCSLDEHTQQQLLQQGWLPSPSSRTGQELRVGRAFLDEQRDDPDGHDVPALVARIGCPCLFIHGDADPTVPVESARQLADAAGPNADCRVVRDADHVFNTPNPMPEDQSPSPQLAELTDQVIAFGRRCCNRA